MVDKVNAHAKQYGWLTSLELTISLSLSALFWYGVYLVIISSEPLSSVGQYVLPMPVYGVARVFLHMTGKIRVPFIP